MTALAKHLDRYTLGELALVERLTGLGLVALVQPSAPQAKTLAALYLVEKKRAGEKVTFDDVLNLAPTEVMTYLNDALPSDSDEPDEDADEDPKASSKPKRTTSRSSSSSRGSSRASTGG